MNYNSIDAVRATELKRFISNPDKYGHECKQPKPILTPDALRIGTLVHKLYLEPETMEGVYIYDGGISSITSRIAKKHVDVLTQHEEWYLLSDYELASNMVKALPKLPKDSNNEVTFVKEIEGVQCKCKVDAYWAVGLDLKTCQDASPNKFKWAIRDHGYMWQMAFYSLVSGIDEWIIRSVEKTAPYIWHDYIVTAQDLEPYKEKLLGEYGYIKAFKNWKDNGMPLQGYSFDRTTKISELL